VDEERRAILSAFVGGRPFAAFYGDPRTRDAALAQLGRTLRRVHDLPLPPDADVEDPRAALAAVWSVLEPDAALPAFVGDAARRVLAEPAPAPRRAAVLSHNDVNPGNLVYDGGNLLLLDWDHAGPNDPFYDLAAISVFLAMDTETCRKLLAAYDGEPAPELTGGFAYNRRLVAVLCGAVFLQMARQTGHAPAGEQTADSTPSLLEYYQRMRAGSLSMATPEGKWLYGLGLVKEGFAPGFEPAGSG
jgi:aminoglycoside phosphotransferase (APT) family kinase protein